MPGLKISVELSARGPSLRKALPMAARLGAGAVEIDARGEITPELSRTGVRQLRKMLDDQRLRVSALRFRTRRGYGTLEELDVRVAATKAAMRLAYDLGASLVTNHLGLIPSDAESASWRLLVEVLEELGEHGHRVGALLAAETSAADGPQLARLLADLPEGAIVVDLNPGALLQNGFSPLDAIDAVGPSIHLVHATDAHGGVSSRPGEPALLGRGEVDFPALLGALEEHGYRGDFTVSPTNVANPEAEIAAGIQYLRGL